MVNFHLKFLVSQGRRGKIGSLISYPLCPGLLSFFLQLVYRLLGHAYGVTYCQFSPSGHLLASCSWDDNVGLWDVSTGHLLQTLRGHTSPVSSCSFSPGGTSLVSLMFIVTFSVVTLLQKADVFISSLFFSIPLPSLPSLASLSLSGHLFLGWYCEDMGSLSP